MFQVLPSDRNELFSRLQYYMNYALKCMDGSIIDVAERERLDGRLQGVESLNATDLPFVSKLLILAAYICSRNKPDVDRVIFDSSYKGRRRHNKQASDRQVREIGLE